MWRPPNKKFALRYRQIHLRGLEPLIWVQRSTPGHLYYWLPLLNPTDTREY